MKVTFRSARLINFKNTTYLTYSVTTTSWGNYIGHSISKCVSNVMSGKIQSYCNGDIFFFKQYIL